MSKGNCKLAIRFENRAEYLKWKRYIGNNQAWEFEVSYPAIMYADFEFHDSEDVEILVKRIVQLMEMGFNVHSANWSLKEE